MKSGAIKAAVAFGIVLSSGCSGSAALPSLSAASRAMAPAQITPAAVTYRIVRNLGAGYDGAYPAATLTAYGGLLYGTTTGGGAHLSGTAFSISPAGKERVLYSFLGGSKDGQAPQASLVPFNGVLYGLTQSGGQFDGGTAFRISPTGGAYKKLHDFGGAIGPDAPLDRLTVVGSTLYGTSKQGGRYGYGSVFSIKPDGTERVLYDFTGGSDGRQPTAGLLNVAGTLYGTTNYGGTYAYGTVFSITTGGKLRVLHSFGNGYDGRSPAGGLINVAGTFYGTTYGGGKYGYYGTIFSMKPSGAVTILYNFTGQADGASSEAALVHVKGTLYGTTTYGGKGVGTVFAYSLSSRKETVLHTFGAAGDGSYPEAGLLFLNGTLYGTTAYGGSNNEGTVFKLVP